MGPFSIGMSRQGLYRVSLLLEPTMAFSAVAPLVGKALLPVPPLVSYGTRTSERKGRRGTDYCVEEATQEIVQKLVQKCSPFPHISTPPRKLKA